MSVRIRMKKMGRTHRPFFRICAFDKRAPRDGRALEELGTYDPMIPDADARAILKRDRVAYWLSVGAQPSDKVAVLIKKYGEGGTHVDQQAAALERLAMPPEIPDAGEPASLPKAPEPEKSEEEKAAEAASAEAPAADASGESGANIEGGDSAGDDLPKQGETPEAKIEEEKSSEADTVEQGAPAAAAEAEAEKAEAGEEKSEEKPAE